jgi:hypothetical protein
MPKKPSAAAAAVTVRPFNSQASQAALDFSMIIYATHVIKHFEFLQRKRKELLNPYDVYL